MQNRPRGDACTGLVRSRLMPAASSAAAMLSPGTPDTDWPSMVKLTAAGRLTLPSILKDMPTPNQFRSRRERAAKMLAGGLGIRPIHCRARQSAGLAQSLSISAPSADGTAMAKAVDPWVDTLFRCTDEMGRFSMRRDLIRGTSSAAKSAGAFGEKARMGIPWKINGIFRVAAMACCARSTGTLSSAHGSMPESCGITIADLGHFTVTGCGA